MGLELATTVVVIGIVAGCASKKKDDATQKPPSAFTVRSPGGNTNIIITPASSLVGRIASVNAQANIVVVSFPVGQMPENGAKFSLFRAGAKVGEVKISGPAAETFTVGDIVAGSAREGDEVRAE